ncbi:MAG: hypothetical protein SFT90_02005 [Rickettsiales bacterium]|nr:hypothetical protein [Rickettsiales bacterium]
MSINTENISERRLVNRLKSYWDNLRENAETPLFQKFNQNSIIDMWDNCMHFQANATSQRKKIYQCKHIGKNLTIAFGKELKDRYVSSYDKRILPGSNLAEAMDNACDNRVFVLSSGQFVNKGNIVIKYRDCIMPFCNIDDTITDLVIGISWKSF